MSFAETVVQLALTQMGAPYIWAGRGDYCVRNQQIEKLPQPGFDCAGLVTWAAWKAGAQDLRGWWGADHLWLSLPDEGPGDFRLVFYGQGNYASHVALDLGHELVLEASGGDSTTLTYEDSMRRGALVKVGFEKRRDRLGYRSLSAVKDLPLKPSMGTA